MSMSAIMTDRFKRTGEVSVQECPKGKKDCFLCEYKYPCKVHKAYRSWTDDPVCIAVKKEGVHE